MYRPVGEWHKDKHFYFQKYVRAFTKATKNASKRYYVDMFAGPGRCEIRGTGETIDGSPRIALSADPPFNRYFFIDIDDEYCIELEKIKEEYLDREIEIMRGDCNEEIFNVLEEIETRSPTLVLLDPTKELYKWSTIEELSRYQTDLFLNLPFYMSTRRLLTNKGEVLAEERIDEFFGDLDWRSLYDRKLHGEGVGMGDFMRLYQEGLRELGYLHTSDNAALIKNVTGQPLYYLILASKNPVARKIFEDVLRYLPDGQRSLF